MPSFNTRIELHKLSSANHRDTYNQLHAAMERVGFKRSLLADDGYRYHLPHAEYDKESSTQTFEDVLEQARKIANSVHTPNSVITWQYSKAAWYDLEGV